MHANASHMQLMAHSSRRRSLLGDLAEGLGQQMYFWGCDVRMKGNLLIRCGMERVARASGHGEGSSRYRQAWSGGVVELHSYCAGWYPAEGPRRGVVFIRSRERVQCCTAGEALTPGVYERERMVSPGVDEMLEAVRPLVGWMLAHEEAVARRAGNDFREACWELFRTQTQARPWLRPREAREWLGQFLEAPERLARARKFSDRNEL